MMSNSFKTRLDRAFVRLTQWEAKSLKMVGMEAIPGLAYSKQVRGQVKQLRVLPSDHYGLFLRLEKTSSLKVR